MAKHNFERVTFLLRTWELGLRITYKEVYQIKETSLLEDFQQRQQLKWLAFITRRENSNIMKTSYSIIPQKEQGRKLP